MLDISSEAETGVIDKNFIDRYIDRIYIYPEDGKMKLMIKLFTGEVTEKYIKHLNSRFEVSSGVMIKKMIEKYENDIKSSK